MAELSDSDPVLDEEPEIDQPELSKLREVVRNHLPTLPCGRSLRKDGVAGLTGAIANVPEERDGAVTGRMFRLLFAVCV